jgi:hypothetical protein
VANLRADPSIDEWIQPSAMERDGVHERTLVTSRPGEIRRMGLVVRCGTVMACERSAYPRNLQCNG